MNTQILQILLNANHSTLLAYYDSQDHPGESINSIMNKRNLNFRAENAVSVKEAVEIMGVAVPNGYNVFEAALLTQLPENSLITLARENSVCIYVNGKLSEDYKEKLACDEFDYDENKDETRIWWD
jgi:hypothetical protein